MTSRSRGNLQPSILDAFLEVVIHCLRATVGVEAVVAAFGTSPPSPPQTLSIVVDFDGDLRGPMAWTFPPEISLELVRRLLADPDVAPDTEVDGATELANILTGRAAEVLEQRGFHCKFGVPRIHEGGAIGGELVRMTTALGPIDIRLSIVGAA
jgi:CheY-specific phosphatase CheX